MLPEKVSRNNSSFTLKILYVINRTMKNKTLTFKIHQEIFKEVIRVVHFPL